MMNKSTVLRGTLINGTVAYAAGDQLGAAVSLTGWAWGNTTSNIMSLDVVLLSGYAGALDLHFWDASPTLVADNAAGTFTVANMSANHLGMVKIATTDWTTIGGMFNYTKPSVGITVGADKGIVYMTGIAQGTFTFTAASHVIVTAGLLQDG